MSDELLLPEGACLVHVGPFKTGSSAIQSALASARPELPRHGVVYPGTGTRARRAGWAVLETLPRGRPAPTEDEWTEFVDEVHAARGMRVCVSNEDFGRAGPHYVERIVGDLGRDRVHVVIVARRLDKLLPSQWQERVRCYEKLGYEDFLRVVLEDTARSHATARAFWQSHDMGEVIDRWASQVGPERVTVIATGNDRELLPRTFERMLGLPVGLLQLDVRGNPSLSYNAIELYRRINESFEKQGWPDHVYHHVMQNGLHRNLQRLGPTSDERMPPLPRWAADRVRELSEERVAAIRDRGVQTVGDVDGLVPGDLDTVEHEVAPELISLDAAVSAVEGAVRGALAVERRMRKLARAGKPAAAEGPGTPRSVDDTPARDLLRVVAGRALRRVRARR